MSLRDGPLGDIKVPLTWTAALAVVVAIVAALALLLGDRRETMRSEAYDATRKKVDQVAAPVGGVLSTPIHWLGSGSDYVKSYFMAGSENRRLKAELAEAGKWREQAEALSEENARYRALMGVKTDPPIAMVFARTVIDSRGPFANTRLADVGSDRGVIEGNPVLGEHGLVGRIVGVAPTASRILLLTDTESRTPVLVARVNARAILTGDGSGAPKLNYLRAHDPLKEGDRVLTSGDGGVFPRGLPVGTVVKDVDGGWRVALDADTSPIDFVQILLFHDFSQLIAAKSLEPKELPSAMTEEPNASIIGAGKPAAATVKPAQPAVAKPAGPSGAKPTPGAALVKPAPLKPPVNAAAVKPVAKPVAGAAHVVAKPAAKPVAAAGAAPAKPKPAKPKPPKPAAAKPAATKPTPPPPADDEGPPI